ncbi:hypothetical protein CDV36_015455 [Fusarium kuroshium]|uniref:LITAF domain-containing protein n=3 Tax=Fusarium solani species complex TaxID=232080 RepID=A0A3M2RAX5_9HYPO|nr:hypothetical protein CDV36_015455 [Fusarium kuroshium]RSL77519.1 hypothetical protein CEP51_008998 [Fusarium floridanum]RSM21090.1 hypothetical protein CDV31_000138 [Fusarium ambrosium]
MSDKETRVPSPGGAPPPSYDAAAGGYDEKPSQTQRHPQRVLNTFLDDEGLPEVVTQDHIAKDTGFYDAPIPVNPDPTPMTQIYETTATVTPLHLLGDQSDTVDCPFCRHRVETRVKKNPSMRTHITATALGITTIGGAVAPYAMGWNSHISHYCTNCNRKVAYRRYGTHEMKPLGTPDHLREVSRYPAIDSPTQAWGPGTPPPGR